MIRLNLKNEKFWVIHSISIDIASLRDTAFEIIALNDSDNINEYNPFYWIYLNIYLWIWWDGIKLHQTEMLSLEKLIYVSPP